MLEVAILVGAKYNDGNALESQIALQGPGASCTPGLAYSPFGFKGRPRSADAPDASGTYQNGALVLYWYEGSVLHTLPLDDGRRSTKLPALDEGGSCWYGDTDDAVSLYDGAGNLTLRAPKSATVTIADKGSTVKIGDNPAALALGNALQSVITALQTFATAAKAATVEPTLSPAATALGTALQLILSIQTTELQAT